MELYIYKAKDILNNKIVRGEMESENEEHVKRFLSDKYLFPISIKRKSALNSDLGEVGIFKKAIRLKDVTFFCKQFAAMIQAGISVARALEISSEQTSHKGLKKHLKNIHEEVNRGRTLSEAARDENVFPDILVSMMECGEASGTLDKVLNQMVEHFDHQLATVRKLKKALTYPAIVITVVIAVVFAMMIFVIPKFVTMFEDMEIALPLPTIIVMKASSFFVSHWLILLVLTGGLVFAGLNIKKFSSGKIAMDKLSIRAPLFGDLNRKYISSTFAGTMAMLISSGLPMLQAIEIVKKVINNAVAEIELDQAIEALKHGNTLHDALKGSKIYPIIMFSMINIGEETGALDDMLAKVGKYFNDEVQAAIDSLMMLIEPMLTIFIAVVVGGIMMAVMLPTFSAAIEIL